jgi:hypothetical protein
MRDKMKEKITAYIFQDVGGWYVQPDELDYCDCRGDSYHTKTAAMRQASASGYTHIRFSKKPITKIRQEIHKTNWATG